jgi:hypothetical protein
MLHISGFPDEVYYATSDARIEYTPNLKIIDTG